MTIYDPSYPPIEVVDSAITPFVLRHADRLADKVAIVDGATGEQVTYAALRDRIQRLAGALRARGFGPGTTAALMAPNGVGFVVVFHAVALAGGTVTTLNPTYGAEELAFQIRDSGADWMFTVSPFAEAATGACDAAGVTQRVMLDATVDGWQPVTALDGAEPLTEQVAIDPANDVVVLPYSSGTTGLAKGVMLTHRNLVANLLQTAAPLGLGEEEVVFAVLPFFHIYGMNVLMNYALCNGATLVTVPRFDMMQMLQLTQDHGITRLFLVPPIVLGLAKHPAVDQFDMSSVRQIFSGAAPLGAELAEAAAARCGCGVAQGYGMTELSPVTHAIGEGESRPGSSGRGLPNTEARLVDPDTGVDAPRGGPGELWIRGPQVMKGYLNNEEATRHTIDADGWLHTGDIATIDDDGFLFIVDRLKELIKVKGFQVPPAELEALVIQHPEIADVAVIGIPDDEAGERPKAFVVRAPGSSVDSDGVKAFVAERVATYKQLHEVVFLDEIPKSASGKILRRLLRSGST